VDTGHRKNPPLPDGQYYHHQLLGLNVLTTGGELLGAISEILPGQSNDNYIVEGPRGQVLIPAIEDVIQSVDLEKGEIIIEPIRGLLDLNEKKPPK
jgi:16S rRNA processing protein RimM